MNRADLKRRRVPRRAFEGPVGVLVSGSYGVQTAFQVGEGGMMISCREELEIGTRMVISFFLKPEVPVIVRAVVRNILPAEGDLPERYGVEFANLAFTYKREIRNFVASGTEALHQKV